MITKRNISNVQNFYNIGKIKNINSKYKNEIDKTIKDVISNALSKNQKEIHAKDISYHMTGGYNYEGYCDGLVNNTQCEPGQASGNCQLGGSLYNGYCDASTGNDNLSQCSNVGNDDTCGGKRPYLMNLVDFKKETNKIIKKYKNEIGYDTIKINKNALSQLRVLIENHVVFS